MTININYFQSNEEQEFEQFMNGFLNPNSGKLVKPAPGFLLTINFYYRHFKIVLYFRNLYKNN